MRLSAKPVSLSLSLNSFKKCLSTHLCSSYVWFSCSTKDWFGIGTATFSRAVGNNTAAEVLKNLNSVIFTGKLSM